MLAEAPTSRDENSEEAPEAPLHQAVKSYNNQAWLHSRGAREVRILCEYLEVRDRLARNKIMCTFLVFGSARCFNRPDWDKRKGFLERQLAACSDAADRLCVEHDIRRHDRLEWLCAYHDKVYRLSKRLMEWIHTDEATKAIAKVLKEVPSPVGISQRDMNEMLATASPVAMCTGGGSGMMEAANRGAAHVPNTKSIGMGVSLPFESGVNNFVDRELSFNFHYFFTRKFWMVYSAIAVIAAPGGVGTLDELMEVLTLKQSKKLKRDIPVVLFGKTFWKDVMNFDRLVEYGTVSEKDRDQLFYTDDEEEAFNYLRDFIVSGKLELGDSHVHKSLRPNVEL